MNQSQGDAPLASRRTLLTWSTVMLIAVLVVVLIVVKIEGTSTTLTTITVPPAAAAPAAIVKQATHVPEPVLAAVGETAGTTALHPLRAIAHQPSLGGHGALPEVLFVGDEFQAQSAAQRWVLVVALSRFGTFKKLESLQSGANQVFPQIASLGFADATFTSSYLHAVLLERTTNQKNGANTRYTSLHAVASDISSLLTRYDRPTATTGVLELPFLDLDNQFVQVGGQFSPAILEQLTAAEIARSLKDPTAPSTRAIVAAANVLTKDLCTLTGDQPASACTPTASNPA